jgi:hypothetical protein
VTYAPLPLTTSGHSVTVSGANFNDEYFTVTKIYIGPFETTEFEVINTNTIYVAAPNGVGANVPIFIDITVNNFERQDGGGRSEQSARSGSLAPIKVVTTGAFTYPGRFLLLLTM